MKKSLLISMMLILVFVGTFSPIYAVEKTQVKVLTWWLSAFNGYLQKMEKDFEAKNPNVDIVMQNFDGNINEHLATRIAAGDLPDLVNLNNETAVTYYQQGALEPLDFYLSKQEINTYITSLWNRTKFDGKFGYTFPWYASPQVLFINNDLFKKAGLDPVKDSPKTWEDMYRVAKIIKMKTGVYGFTMEFANIAWEEVLRVGGKVFADDLSKVAFNTPKVASRLEYFRKLYAEDLLPKSLPDYQTARAMFDQGQLAMFPLGISMYRWIKAEAPQLNFSVTPYPVSPKGANQLHVSMMNFVLMKGSKVKKEAVAFAKFITSAKAQIEFAKGQASIIPATKVSVESDPFFAKGTDGKARAQLLAAKTMKNCDNLICTKIPKNVDQIYNTIRDQFLAAIRGEKSVKDALKAAEKQANQMISANK